MNEEDVVATNPDVLPDQPLDDIFTLPPHIAEDPQIARWHDEQVRKLRADAAGVPMSSVQEMLLERIAYTYADMRYKERTQPNRSSRDRRDDNAAFMTMTDSFNRLLEKHNDKRVNDMLVQVQDILLEAFDMVTDESEKSAVRRFLAEQLAAINL